MVSVRALAAPGPGGGGGGGGDLGFLEEWLETQLQSEVSECQRPDHD